MWIPIAAAGVGALGSLAGGILQGDAQEASNEFNAQQAQINRDWQTAQINSARDYNTHMANTAHQREVADLRAAGINPMLTAMGGNGAPAPSSPVGTGAQAQGQAATGYGQGVAAAMSSAFSAAKTVADIRNTDKDSLLKEAGALAAAAQTQQSTASARQLTEVTHQLQRARNANAAKADAEENKAKIDKANDATDRLLNQLKTGSGIANDAGSVISNLLPSKALTKNLGKAFDQGYLKGRRAGVPVP